MIKGEIPVQTTWDFFPFGPGVGHYSCNNISVITELITKIWQCRNTAKQKSDWAGSTCSQMIRQVVNKLPG